MSSEQNKWLCYVSAERCTGPAEVKPNPNHGPEDGRAWVAATPEVKRSGMICEAHANQVLAGADQLHFHNEGTLCYLLCSSLEDAVLFMGGVVAARATMMAAMGKDAVELSFANLSRADEPKPKTHTPKKRRHVPGDYQATDHTKPFTRGMQDRLSSKGDEA